MLNYRPPEAAGPPVTLCDPTLARFLDNVNGGVEPDYADSKFVVELAYDMRELSFKDEAARRNSFLVDLQRYLGYDLVNYSFGGKQGATDGSIIDKKDGVQAPMLNVEVKPEIGMGGGCATRSPAPTTRASSSTSAGSVC